MPRPKGHTNNRPRPGNNAQNHIFIKPQWATPTTCHTPIYWSSTPSASLSDCPCVYLYVVGWLAQRITSLGTLPLL